MAEIRSTLDLVLERAARMGTADAGEMRADELNRRGMRLGAEFLDSAEGKPDALAKRLKDAPEAEGRNLANTVNLSAHAKHSPATARLMATAGTATAAEVAALLA